MPTLIASYAASLRWAELIPRYAIGSVAMFWVVQRVAGVPKVLGSISRGPKRRLTKAAFVRPKSNSPIERWIRESCTRCPCSLGVALKTPNEKTNIALRDSTKSIAYGTDKH